MSWKKGSEIRFFRSVSFKLTLWYSLVLFISCVAVSTYLYYRLVRNLQREVDRFLEDEAREFATLVQVNPGEWGYLKDEIGKETSTKGRYYQMYYGLLDTNKRVLVASGEFTQEVIPSIEQVLNRGALANESSRKTIPSKDGKYMIRTACLKINPSGAQPLYAIVAVNLKRIESTLQNYLENIYIATPFVLLLAIVGGYFLAKRNLSPIVQIANAARRISVSNLKSRIKLRGTRDELDYLASTINAMVDRIHKSINQIIRFTSDASHELRTPLTAIRGAVDMAMSRDRPASYYKKVLLEVAGELDKVVRIMNSLLQLSRADASQETLYYEEIRLDQLLGDLHEVFKLVAKNKGITFSFHYSGETVIYGDRVKLQQLFTNIIDNAIKYTNSPGRIFLSLEETGDSVKIIFKDTGVGISNYDLPHIFDRFYRADKSSDRDNGGSGLGLSICKSIVELHGGKIEASSELGKGSTFKVMLPRTASLPRAHSAKTSSNKD